MRLISVLAALLLGALPLASANAATAAAPASAAIAASAGGQDLFNLNLPKLGLAGGGAFPLWKAEAIGRQIYYAIQQEDGVLNDPLVADYVDYLGHQLSSVANAPDEPFHYFVVLDPQINAFALPGAFIGVNSGLFEATRTEDELAGVLAHETAHVVQRHIARQVADAHYNNLINLAILLGAIAVAAANPDLSMAAISGAQGGIAQRQINYTRADELEADRVGISILARAHFNPQGMIGFFQYMQRQYAMQGFQIPEFLSTHPLDITRVSEAQQRARDLHVKPRAENPNFALMKARVRVLTSDDPVATLAYYRVQSQSASNPWYREAAKYAMVLCMSQLNQGKEAVALAKPLAAAHPDNIALQLALAQAMIAAGDTKAGLAALAQDNRLYGPSMAVAMTYAQALYDAGDAREAVGVLQPLAQLDGTDPIYDPDFYQLLGSAANKIGNHSLAY
ncbi:MAG TPA: M48 family metalloprotease, partial [Gammaproteobacteria bacterium]|nr:M48 family metalloprotease [Gammaproteobacteria bacterium]